MGDLPTFAYRGRKSSSRMVSITAQPKNRRLGILSSIYSGRNVRIGLGLSLSVVLNSLRTMTYFALADRLLAKRVPGALAQALFVLGILVGSSACSLYVDSQRRQCSSDQECITHNTAFARSRCSASVCTQPTAWSCLGHVSPSSAGTGSVVATFVLVDLISGAPAPGVGARICRKLDIDCNDPLSAGHVSDSAGKLALTVPSGFDGYVELSPLDAMPGMYFFYPPVVRDRQVFPLPMVSVSALAYLSQLAGVQVLEERSPIFLGAHNCLDAPASGVAFSSADADATTVPFYLIQGIPSVSAKETDSGGRGGLLNVRIGSVTVTGALANGERVSTASVVTRKGRVTYAAVVPTVN